MNVPKKRVFAILAAALCLGANAATVDLSALIGDYEAQDGDTLAGATEYAITIASGATVTLDGVTITHVNGNVAAVSSLGDATIILAPGSANSVTNTVGGYAGIRPVMDSTLTISGTGSLAVQGGGQAAGIGSNSSGDRCGNIVIAGGTITATGGSEGCAIGASLQVGCGNILISGGTITAAGGENCPGVGTRGETASITITGGNVTATGGSNSRSQNGGAGIGSMYDRTCGAITISGGTVSATGGAWSAGIGSAYYGTCGDITITGGTVTADIDRATGDNTTCTAAIGAGCRGTCGNILITGGTVVADAHSGYSRDDACAIGATYSNGKCGDITITDGITSVTVTKGATAQQHIGQGDGSATVGKVSRMLRLVTEYSNDGNTLTLTPGSDFETYTVTWKSDDGTTIGTTSVEYGLMPEHANATKASDADFDYVFAGWTPELAEVESNTTYTAVFSPLPRVRSTGGNAEWFFEADGSLRSGAIGNSENTWFRASLPRPCVFTFEWKTSSENGCDWLNFKVNGEDAYDTEGNIIGRISNERDWATVSIVVSNSLDVLEWEYSKDHSDKRGQDCGWIRNFSMAPYDGEVCTLSVVPNHDGEATVNAYASKDCVLGVFPVVARHGYAFLGFFTAAEGGELVEPPYALSADTTLYAHWAKTTDFDTSAPTAEWTIEDDGITWRTGVIGHSANTWATYTVKRPCTVTYKWKTSTETGNDPLVFYVDGVELSRISGEMSDWADVSLTFEDSANHVLKWVYSKDGSATGKYDCGWIRDFVVAPLDSWAVTRDLNYEGAGELETRYVKKGNQLDVSEFPPLDEPPEGYTCVWFTAPWSGDALTNAVDISADTTIYAHWIRQHGFDEIDTDCQTPWTWLDDGSIRTGKIGDSQNTWATISVTGPCDVSFMWMTSSESNWDKLRFYVDGSEKKVISGVKSDWESYSVSVDSGDHVLKWAYTKDSSGAMGEDCGWIKDIVITEPDSAPYTVTWKNADGTALETDTGLAAAAIPAYNSALPTRAATAQYTYDFAGWAPELELVSSNTTYTAAYTATLRSYDVAWQDEDGTPLGATNIFYGATPVYDGETPTKAETAEYTYTFAGWTPAVAAVTDAATYTATFNATKRSYTITWKNDDGSVLDATSVEYGATPTHAAPTKAETAEYTYTFAGWTPAVAAVTGAATYTATFNATKRSYTITWKNDDGSVIDTTSVEYGATPTHAAPTKAETAEYTYTFAGWTPAVAAVTGTATYTATFNATKRSYTITWKNDDGSVIDTTSVEYGATPTHAAPTKAETAEYTYTFAGWTPAVASVTGVATYTATFNATKRSYTITWLNDDGSVIDTTSVEYGATPTHAAPTKAETAEYTYTFAGWTPAVAAVTGATTYTATFNATKRSYTITWKNDDGSVIDTTSVEYGATPTHAAPMKAETAEYTYTFAGWTPAVAAVTGAATYTATFNVIPKGESGTIDISTLANGDIVQDGSVLTGTAPNLNLKVADGATITLDGVCITNSAHGVSVLHCLGDATIILAPGSENTVVGTVGRYCTGNAIYVPTNGILTITGSGSLYADSSSSDNRSAAIGAFAYPYNADYIFPCGNIVIEGGTITAKGGVGIGASGNGGYCGDITITGDANVTAIATVNGSTGIGSAGSNGNCGDITISGNASVTATGKYNGPGIGAADRSACGDIVIATTGTVTATGNYFAPGIGAFGGYETCSCGDITISGGTVIATGDQYAAGIGTDYYYQRSGACGNITIADTITEVVAQGQNSSPGIYTVSPSEFTYGSHLELVTSDENRCYTLTPVVAPDTYTVTWKNDDGTTLKTDIVAYGDTPEYNGATPTKTADAQYTYTFDGWTPTVGAATSNTTYTATFSEALRSYTVAWVVEGATVASGAVEYGTTPRYGGDTPTKESTAEYSYTFSGWSPTVAAVTGAATYTAQFNATKRSYTITWANIDGEDAVATSTVEYGQTPVYGGATPTKESTAEYSYTFSGWSPTVAAVTGEATYTAQFNATKRSYTVSWVVEGATVASGAVEYGTTPTYGGDTPTKESTAEYSYTFSGWSPTVAAVTGDATYTAQFEATKRSYMVAWVVEGVTVASGAVEYGTTPTYSGETPTKESTAEYSYTFSGWSPTVAAVTGAATYTAQFNATKRSYTVSWVVEGTTVASGAVEYGQMPTYTGATPTKESTAEYSYTFSGWSPTVAAVTGAATYTAQFNATKRNYTITWANIDGAGAVATSTAEYGTMPTYGGAAPTKAETAEYTYTFAGWSPSVASVTGPATYAATFTATPKEEPDPDEPYDATETINGITWSYTVANGEATINGTYETATCLVIPDTVSNNIPVTAIAEGAFADWYELEEVTIGRNVRRIGNDVGVKADDWAQMIAEIGFDGSYPAFGNCENLMNYRVDANNTMFEEIGGALYYRDTPASAKTLALYPSGRDSLYFPEGIVVTKIGDGACAWCHQFSELAITNSVREIGVRAFDFCREIVALEIPSSVTNICYGAFLMNIGIEDVEINGTNLAIGDYAFAHSFMSSDTSRLVIRGGVRDIGFGAFYRSMHLDEVVMEDGVTNIAVNAFSQCDDLAAVALPDTLLTIGAGAFSECCNLSSLIVPLSVTEIGLASLDDEAEGGAFANCSGLTEIYMPRSLKPVTDEATLAYLADVFYGLGLESMTATERDEILTWYSDYSEIGGGDEPDPGDGVEWLYSVEDGEVTITGANPASGFLKIPASIDGKPVTRIGNYAFAWNLNVCAVEIPATVAEIESSAFNGNEYLTNVLFAAGGSAPLTISQYAFGHCERLEAIEFPARLAVIDECGFNECHTLADVTFLGTGADIAYNAFKATPYLASLPFEVLVNGEGGAYFVTGTPPNDMAASDWPAGVKTIGAYLFYNNTNLTSVVIPNTVESVEYEAFYWCTALTNIVFEAAAVGEESLPLEIDTEAFALCENLQGVTFREGTLSVGPYAFNQCGNLAEVNLPTEGIVTIAESAFAGTAYDAAKPFSMYMGYGNVVEGYHGTCPAVISASDWPDGAVEIGSDVFKGCATLTQVTFPAGLVSIGWQSFAYCPNLASVNFANCAATLEYISNNAFAGCTALESAILDGDNLCVGDNAFQGCTSLTTLVLGGGTAQVGGFAFANCGRLAAFVDNSNGADIDETAFIGTAYYRNMPFAFITREDWDYGGVTVVGNKGACPAQITADMWPENLTQINRMSFTFNDELVAVEFPETLARIDESAFACCTNLVSITFPEENRNMNDNGLEVSMDAFALCTKLRSVTLRGNLSVNMDAFAGCSSLETVAVEEGVRGIDQGAFALTALRSIVLPENMEWVEKSAFATGDNDFTVYVPRSVTVNHYPLTGDENYGLFDGSVSYTYEPRIFGLETEEGWAQYGLVDRDVTTNLRVVPYCRVTLDLAGGTGVATNTIGVGNFVEDQFPHPVREGYTFAGWTSARVPTINPDTPWVVILGINTGMDTCLTATWTPNAEPEEPTVVIDDDKMEEPVVNPDGTRTVGAKDGQTLTQADADRIDVKSPLDGTTSIKGAYTMRCDPSLNRIVITLAAPQVVSDAAEADKDDEDPSGMLDEVADIAVGRLAEPPTPDASKGEELGALPVKMYPGLYYQVSWGGDLGNLTTGAKFRADGAQTHIGVIKQTGSRGFYKISVSEK